MGQQCAGWSEGDWNGDGVFNSDDFITAFQDGGYEQGPRTDVAAVPEPTTAGAHVGCCVSAGLACARRSTTARRCDWRAAWHRPTPTSTARDRWSGDSGYGGDRTGAGRVSSWICVGSTQATRSSALEMSISRASQFGDNDCASQRRQSRPTPSWTHATTGGTCRRELAIRASRANGQTLTRRQSCIEAPIVPGPAGNDLVRLRSHAGESHEGRLSMDAGGRRSDGGVGSRVRPDSMASISRKRISRANSSTRRLATVRQDRAGNLARGNDLKGLPRGFMPCSNLTRANLHGRAPMLDDSATRRAPTSPGQSSFETNLRGANLTENARSLRSYDAA